MDASLELECAEDRKTAPFGVKDGAVDRQAFHDYLEQRTKRRQVNKVLHCHPSPRLWREEDFPLDRMLQGRRETLGSSGKSLNVYVASPYCPKTEPTACGFCLFPHEDYRGPAALDRYYAHLRREGAMLREHLADDRVSGVYFGGGTPNLVRADGYQTLMDMLTDVFPDLPSDIEITLEGLPQLFTREKLVSLKAAGFNRISMGVQQLDADLIRHSGRRQSADQVFRVLDWCEGLGLKTSIDLIYGWPQQTLETMVADLQAAVATGISHLTHYELNVGGRSHFARHMKSDLPSIERNIEMFHTSRQVMQAAGFRQVTTYDWERQDGEFSFEHDMRQFLTWDETRGMRGTDMWGWGFAGVSHFMGTPEAPGFSCMNTTRVERYVGSVADGALPLERAYRHSRDSMKICWLFQGLQSIGFRRSSYRGLFDEDLIDAHVDLWRVLEERGWVELGEEEVALTGDGIYYTPLIQNAFSDWWDAGRNAPAGAAEAH